MTTLAEIFEAELLDVTATEAEIDAWGTLTQIDRTVAARLMGGRLQTNPNTVTTSVGLFGFDLTAFNEACTAAADTEICDPADYTAYNGWGVGVNWSSTAAVTDALVDGVVFATSLWSVEVAWDAEGNAVKAGEVASVAADAPTEEDDVTEEEAADPFDAWQAGVADSDGP